MKNAAMEQIIKNDYKKLLVMFMSKTVQEDIDRKIFDNLIEGTSSTSGDTVIIKKSQMESLNKSYKYFTKTAIQHMLNIIVLYRKLNIDKVEELLKIKQEVEDLKNFNLQYESGVVLCF